VIVLVDVQTLTTMFGGIGVGVAAIYYMMNLRMTRRKQIIDNTILYGNLLDNKELVKQWHQVLFEQQFSSYDEWAEKYRSDPEAFSNLYATHGLMAMLGMCLEEGIVDREVLFKRGFNIWVNVVYPRLWPWIRDMRTRYNDPNYGYYSEYFYGEAMKWSPGLYVPKDLNLPQ
jgi:hypothetical protein